MYNSMTRERLYQERGSEEVLIGYQTYEFPDVSQIPCGEMIERCWRGEISSAQEIVEYMCDMVKIHEGQLRPLGAHVTSCQGPKTGIQSAELGLPILCAYDRHFCCSSWHIVEVPDDFLARLNPFCFARTDSTYGTKELLWTS